MSVVSVPSQEVVNIHQRAATLRVFVLHHHKPPALASNFASITSFVLLTTPSNLDPRQKKSIPLIFFPHLETLRFVLV